MEQIGSGKNYKIDEQCLLQELSIAIEDYFVCTAEREEGSALLHFENGQQFRLGIREVV